MSATTPPTGDSHVFGEAPPQQQDYATFETKPSQVTRDSVDSDGRPTATNDSGGGYERWRSYEFKAGVMGGEILWYDGLGDDPQPSRKRDVYVSVHRLAAVAWCYPDDMAVGDILAHLDGRDVHHTTGVEWCNFGESPNFEEPGLQVVGHGAHSEVTQAQMKAWAEDAKQQAEQVTATAGDRDDGCSAPGCSGEEFGTTDSLDGAYCMECVRERAGDGETIEVLQ